MVFLETNWDPFVIFEIVSKYCSLNSSVDYEGYSISSKRFLLTGVDVMVSWIKLVTLIHFSSLIPKMSAFTLANYFQFTLIHGPNIPGSYATFFFTASYFTFSTRLIHNWASFPLWPSLFILSGAISLLFSLAYWTHTDLGGLIFRCNNFLPFHTVHGILKERVLGAVCHSLLQHTVLSELSDMTHPFGDPTWHDSYLHWLIQSCESWDHFG